MSSQFYQFLPYPENKPEEMKIYTVIAKERATNREFESRAYWNGERWDGGNILSFLAPIPADPDDEKAAEEWLKDNVNNPTTGYYDAFLAGCAHKAQDLAKYGDMASALSKAGQEIERLRRAFNK